MESAHRQIELQSQEDLAYLLNNVRRAAQEQLDKAFPQIEGSNVQEDELRAPIERLVNEVYISTTPIHPLSNLNKNTTGLFVYINKTFTFAAPNLSINGLPADPAIFLSSNPSDEPEEAYEPWDARLRQRVEDLAREEEDLLNEIAALKKSVPGAVAAAAAHEFKISAAADDAALEAAKKAREDEVNNIPNGVLPLDGMERRGEIKETFGTAVEKLGRLKKEMPATVAKMERARVAGEYTVTERS
ncbi:Kinetochore protein mis14 [Colletotrichum chlorophyti]|uniref:Kinetochore protein mis14 n=1 Tax=Colletotrichum chlorophyti TaxID=708187 RepID=A0A1Q8S3R1_9PEZI|nr:Kinetochore protein mis14 [Colletotrichum chlorophyti]